MLDPEYLERAGTLVGSVYSQIEAEMCDRLVRDMLAGDISDWHDQRILALLAQGEAPKLRAILEQHRWDVDEAVRREVEEALERSDAHDLRVLKEALGVDLPGIMPMQVMGAVRTVTQMLERDNVAMLSGARDLFYNQSAWAVTQAAAGVMGYDEAIRRATRELARKGIDVIQYKDPQTGNLTVRSAADVAVTRHVRSQLSQQCAARTMQVCGQVGCEFVEVSSHYGARPSHQDWEGRRYHVGGRVTVDGVTYEDFAEATGYYGTGGHGALGDRLCGVNCRHQFGPWMPGMPHAYEPNPQHPSGKSNEEIYRLTQKQRRLERAIRASKREVAAAERAYEADPTLENQTTANQLREQLRRRQDALAKLVDENKDVLTRDLRREYAGDMPKVRVPKGSGRTLDQFLSDPEVVKQYRGAGLTKAETRRRIVENLKAEGVNTRAFSQHTSAEQHDKLGEVTSSQPAEEKRRRREAAAMEQIRRDAPESLEVPYTTPEALSVYGSTELTGNVEPEAVRKLAQGVEDSMLSDDPARRSAARLVARSIDEGRLTITIDEGAETSSYSTNTRAITLNGKGKASARTVVHENAHLSDHQLDATYTAKKITQDGEELRTYTTPAGQYATLHYGEQRAGKTLMRRIGKVNRRGETAAWRDLKRRLGARNDQEAMNAIRERRIAAGLEASEVHGLSDIINAASGGRWWINYRHEPGYWSEHSRVLEAWADYCAALITNPKEAALIRELFPQETAIMDEILEVMAG